MLANNPINTASSEYVTAGETAKLVRKNLAANFPGVKFSVKARSYAGGASIDIKYTGGPRESDVEEVINPFIGSGFDGSIDMKYSCYAWLAADGTASTAHVPGTEGSRGSVAEYIGDAHAPNCRFVHFGANFIEVSRTTTEAEYWQGVERFEQETGWAIRHSTYQAGHYEKLAEKNWRGNYKLVWIPEGETCAKVCGIEGYAAGEDVSICKIASINRGNVYEDRDEAPAMTELEAATRARFSH